MKIAPLRWPACNAGYKGPLPRPMILDTNVVLDMLIFDDPHIPSIRELVAKGEVRWIADQAQREGINNLRQSGLNKVRMGLTSLEEVNRVTKE